MRIEGWVKALYETVESAAGRPFAFGLDDCGLCVASVIDAIVLDSHWVDDLKANYSDEASALRFVAAEGGMEAAVTRRLGEPVPPLCARRGDVCLLPGEGMPALGICMGETVAAMRPEGIRYVSLGEALKAWRVL